MATRKDQLQSHQFLGQRMVSALVARESDPEQPPFRRPLLSAIGGVVIAVIALAVVAVYGLVVPGGNKSWQTGDAVIVEKETGTRYVYLDGRLHPVTNYASALLALGKNAQTRRVSRNSLTGAARGPRIGIADAPDALPPTSRLLTGAWTLCSQPVLDSTGQRSSESVLLVGAQPSLAAPLGTTALLVEVIDSGALYLISNGYRHLVDQSVAVQAGLALQAETWAQVGKAFVNGLPEGQPLAPLKPAAIGAPSSAIPNRRTKIGELFMVRTAGGGRQYYLAVRDKLLMISELQYSIQLAYQPMRGAYRGRAPRAIELSPTALGRIATMPDPVPGGTDGRLPQRRPVFAKPSGGSTVCAVYASGDRVPTVLVDAQLSPRDPEMVTGSRGPLGTLLADRVVVAPGAAALVEAMPSGRAAAGTQVLVTDLGRAYPLADPEVLNLLGYAGAQPLRLPTSLIARIPQGPALNPAQALRPTR